MPGKKPKVSNMGYKANSPDINEPQLLIPSPSITMQGVDQPIMAFPNNDAPTLMQPSQNYFFPNSQYVTEIPAFQNGGNVDKRVTWDKVTTSIGEEMFAPVFHGQWTPQSMQQFMQSAPQEFGGVPTFQGPLEDLGSSIRGTIDTTPQQITPVPQATPVAPGVEPYWRLNPDNSIHLNAERIYNELNPGVRGFDAYSSHNRVTGRTSDTGNYYQDDRLPRFGRGRGEGFFAGIFQNGGQVNQPNYGNSQYYLNQANSIGYYSGAGAQDTPFSIPEVSIIPQAQQIQSQFQPQPLQVQQIQAQPLTTLPSTTAPQGQQSPQFSGANTASAISSAAYAAGDVISGINNIKNQIIGAGGALLNGLIPDQHNERVRSPQVVDSTYAYQNTFNNMYQDGGSISQVPVTPTEAYLPGQEVELSPEELLVLKQAGYTFDII